MKPCFRCGAGKRYKTQSYCYECLREYQRERDRRLHPEKAFGGNKRVPIEELLVVGRGKTTNSQWVKFRVLREGLLEDRCAKCSQGPTWQGEDLVLQLDHINGDWDDNRIENLRILCPNCHTQCPTSHGKNKGKARKNRAGKRGIQASRAALRDLADDWRDDIETEQQDRLIQDYLG